MEQHIIAKSTIAKFANVQTSITWGSLFKGPRGKESEFLKDWSAHTLRRTSATLAGDLGAPPHVISVTLGH